MKKNELVTSLKSNYSAFLRCIDSLSNNEYHYAIEGKWSAGLHLDHLVLSVKPLVSVFELEKTTIGEKFGSTTNQGRSYEEMKSLYFEKLKDGGKAPDRFVPDTKTLGQKSQACQNLKILVDQLSSLIERFSEGELDTLCVPHPLLASLSLREMLYNAIYHAEHHQDLIVSMLNGKFDKPS